MNCYATTRVKIDNNICKVMSRLICGGNKSVVVASMTVTRWFTFWGHCQIVYAVWKPASCVGLRSVDSIAGNCHRIPRETIGRSQMVLGLPNATKIYFASTNYSSWNCGKICLKMQKIVYSKDIYISLKLHQHVGMWLTILPTDTYCYFSTSTPG